MGEQLVQSGQSGIANSSIGPSVSNQTKEGYAQTYLMHHASIDGSRGKKRIFVSVVFFAIFLLAARYVDVSRNSITVHDQPLEDYAIVDEVSISNPSGGRIALTINGSLEGGQRVGTSAWLPSGTYSYVGIPLGVESTDASGSSKILMPTKGDRIYASLFASSKIEQQITTASTLLHAIFGKEVIEKFTVF
ncbi:hypothetical protein HY947_04715 [Candidatus Gottesmanbacteria bacterium]|nr:hypothetical protein [Candidatus Gottesmanbacteria bacterium]